MTIVGVKSMAFAQLSILYDDRVLAPRAWTALQSNWAAELLRTAPAGRVLELCSGVGHIGLLAVAQQPRDLVQVDMSGTACEYARANAAAADLSVAVEVREGPMDQVIDQAERFALIIADPPWLPSSRTPEFPDDPLLAVDGGVDGLDVAHTCIEVIANHLGVGGSALLQLGSIQQVRSIEPYLKLSRLRAIDFRSHEDRGIVVHVVRAES
jgi:release factor glutamine methyltransferase